MRTLIPVAGLAVFLSLPPVPLAAQQPTAGVASEWDLRTALTELNERMQQLDKMLKEIDPASWKGTASAAAYTSQVTAIRNQILGLESLQRQLAEDAERLTLVLEAYIRLQAIQTFLPSLTDGIRRYQNDAMAELLDSTFSDSTRYRDSIREYLVDLVKVKETELDVMNREAQRCRQQVLRRD